MKVSVEEGRLVTLATAATTADGLRVNRVGERTVELVQRVVDELVAVPEQSIRRELVCLMGRCKLVAESAAAATVAAIRDGLVDVPPGTRTCCVLSGGNLDLARLDGLVWN